MPSQRVALAELALMLVMPPEIASATVGDLLESAPSPASFWRSIGRTFASLAFRQLSLGTFAKALTLTIFGDGRLARGLLQRPQCRRTLVPNPRLAGTHRGSSIPVAATCVLGMAGGAMAARTRNRRLAQHHTFRRSVLLILVENAAWRLDKGAAYARQPPAVFHRCPVSPAPHPAFGEPARRNQTRFQSPGYKIGNPRILTHLSRHPQPAPRYRCHSRAVMSRAPLPIPSLVSNAAQPMQMPKTKVRKRTQRFSVPRPTQLASRHILLVCVRPEKLAASHDLGVL